MPVEFLGIAATHDGSETHPRSGASFDKDYTLKLARAHEDHGWDRVLFAYGSGSPDPAPAAAYIAAHLDKLQLLLAHRPNVSYPTFAAKTFATLDRISDGRLTVHFITGGSDQEQGREGDTLTKDQRYSRTREYIEIVKRIWTSHEPFDHEGEHYRFHDFVSDVFPVQQPRPNVSFGGSSDAAHAAERRRGGHLLPVGRATGEDRRADRDGEGRGARRRPYDPAPDPGRVPADHRSHGGAGLGEGAPHGGRHQRPQGAGGRAGQAGPGAPENTGSQRLIAIAEAGERYDRALWTPTAAATGGAGNSNALVGTPETVAQALLDYYDLGVDILSARGYDLLGDAIDFGRHVIPLVREEVAKRDTERTARAARTENAGTGPLRLAEAGR